MHETPHAYFHLDHPVDGGAAPAGPLVLRGWAAGRDGRHLVDLRLRTGGTAHPAVYGFPRADLAAFFHLPGPFLPGGFEAVVPLSPGAQEITFEALDISGQWHPVGTVRLSGEGPRPAGPGPVPAGTVLPHEFARALQCTLRMAATVPVAQAAEALVAALPLPAVIRYPHLPFHGHLHQPTLLERVLFGRLRIEGWLFHETVAIRRVAATVDLQAWQELERAGSKPYVEAMFPQFSQVKDCRIDGLIDVPAQLPNPLCVRIYAELADGSWHLCHVQRTHAWDQEQEKAPFAPFSRLTFGRACLALGRAVRARGVAMHRDRAWWRGVRGVYREYRARALPRYSAPDAAIPAAPDPAPPPGLVTLITHNLSREGAPLFLFEFARQLAAGGTRLQVVSAADGPLAADYARLGAIVQVVDVAALPQAGTARELAGAIARLSRDVDLAGSDLVVANTLSAYWGVHLARSAGRPSLFYIHESTTPATFYLGHMTPATLPLIEETFRIATHVSFLTETTRVYYQPWLGAANHSINPGWIDVTAIDRELAARPREARRRALGLEAPTRLVINVGSVCDRKGQHIFSRGVDLLWRQAPALAESCRFLMVGGRDTLFDRDLARLLGQLNRPNLQVVPATSSPLDFYGAADLFVCSSYEESLPRVIMEAMVCRVPVLSTAVHGIRDLLTPGVDGWLIPPGHSQALSEGLQHLLARPELAAALAARARDRVMARNDAAQLLPRHATLAATVAAAARR
jgi:glycosyltransferase involved in cell wall biosynthesis